MPTLRENLRDHPIQSLLTALASIATILGFILIIQNRTSNSSSSQNSDNHVSPNSVNQGSQQDFQNKAEQAVDQSKVIETDGYEFKQGYYIANGSERNKVYFHNSPSSTTRRNAFINTKETVYVVKIENGFGYIEFENTNGEKSYGWVELTNLILKPQSK